MLKSIFVFIERDLNASTKSLSVIIFLLKYLIFPSNNFTWSCNTLLWYSTSFSTSETVNSRCLQRGKQSRCWMKGDQLFYTFLTSFECCAVLMHHLFREYNFLDNYFRKKSNFFRVFSTMQYWGLSFVLKWFNNLIGKRSVG